MRKPGLTLLSVATPLLLLLVAGCGAVTAPAGSSSGGLVISAEKAAIDTTTTNQLSARLASGAPASVTWAIVGGQNDTSLGQGTISANGLYTPPTLAFARPGASPGHGGFQARPCGDGKLSAHGYPGICPGAYP